MKRWRLDVRLTLLAIVTVLFLSACTNKLAYNTLPFWIDYYLSDYVDMTSTQQKQLDRDLDAFHSWHRQNELPKIRALLENMESQLETPLSYSEINDYHGVVNQTILASLHGLTPALANLIASLSDEQAEQWLKTIQTNVDEAVEKANEGSSNEQLVRRQETLIERAEYWIDTVNRKQSDQFKEMASYQIEMRPVFYSIRDGLFEELTLIFEERDDPAIEQRLNGYFAKLVVFKSDDFQGDMSLYLARRYELLQRMDKHLTETQRKTLRNTLASLSDDLGALEN
ncbi:hypothetical protein A1OW_21410 [Enterovibrio norvegicus]|uniref:DUF6279 family lipoprotein n=1 Tax=Enterovibrio norvegicus TaxID=188144 RepID=UPI0002DCABD4|nr:DUF6279 family lipoprotein [Enterovibrio norvegicus]OEF59784.1 hypothetical protein A1OW_21410 [Enterovibrio norvegicus]